MCLKQLLGQRPNYILLRICLFNLGSKIRSSRKERSLEVAFSPMALIMRTTPLWWSRFTRYEHARLCDSTTPHTHLNMWGDAYIFIWYECTHIPLFVKTFHEDTWSRGMNSPLYVNLPHVNTLNEHTCNCVLHICNQRPLRHCTQTF